MQQPRSGEYIGSGAFLTVYRVRLRNGRVVALKEDNAMSLRMASDEVRAMQLEHPNICRGHLMWNRGAQVFFLVEFGGSLREANDAFNARG